MGNGRGPREAPLNFVEPTKSVSVSGALRARRSCRSFSSRPLEQELVDDLVDRARRTPTAGNSQGVEFLVLDSPKAVATYWDVSLSDDARSSFAFPGLLRAPLLVVPFGLPERYLDRYSEPDKVMTGMGSEKEFWSVPFWLVDAAFAAMAFQLLAPSIWGNAGLVGATGCLSQLPATAHEPRSLSFAIA